MHPPPIPDNLYRPDQHRFEALSLSEQEETSDDSGGSGSQRNLPRGNAPASTSSASLVGLRLGDYQLLRKLGRGGMADVYSARHLSLGREVAIKVLRSDFATDKDYIARFRREARAAAKLNHPNIVQVYDVGDADSHHFIAQELIDGENLRDYLSSQGSLSSEQAIEVLLAVGSALQSAAEMGITHRDIKPENIMRSSRGDIKVADFGLARVGYDADASRANLTQAGLTLGTPRYMSPEQVQGKPVDVRSDLYSLGVTMYHLLTGRPPFEADDPIALAVMHLHETPTPLDRARGRDDLPEWLIAVVGRLMSKLPADRYQTPAEMLDAVRSKAAIGRFGSQEALGTAAATIRLQRVADAVLHRKRRMLVRTLGAFAVSALSAVAGGWFASQTPGQTVNRMLRPEQVAQAESIEQQFLIAVTRDDIAGWEAVGTHFPSTESANNRVYVAKSLIQLARLYSQQGRYADANEVLDRVLADPNVALKYRTVVWAHKCRALEKLNDAAALAAAKRTLEASYKELKANQPEAIEFFNRVVPEQDRLQFQLDNGTVTPERTE